MALFLLGTNRTHAIINGTLDGNLHPNVGVVIFAVGGELLISPFLVKINSAHRLCYGGALPGIHRVPGCDSGVGYRCASHVDADVNFIEVSNLSMSTLIPGTLHPNPAFDAHGPDPNDVAVITFETPVVGITPAVLPTPGLLDELGQQNGLKDQLFTVVGYSGEWGRDRRRGAEDLSEGSEPGDSRRRA